MEDWFAKQNMHVYQNQELSARTVRGWCAAELFVLVFIFNHLGHVQGTKWRWSNSARHAALKIDCKNPAFTCLCVCPSNLDTKDQLATQLHSLAVLKVPKLPTEATAMVNHNMTSH
ncbi:unnamed protein product [Polarella glacialis]|uniref:Uncharacterized protein n=1 Tax=Polarella glacialis TaxID=89957 RepID=A0A813EER2_POLGL|nr:unnamed protein product [Polarella glacialis]